MRSVALANQKGGVGKTTTAIHLAHGLAMAGESVVLLDLDPQGNATLAVQGMTPAEGSEAKAEGPFLALRQLQERLWILPSPGADRSLSRDANLDVDALAKLADSLGKAGTDWLVVDCPPRMDQWGWAGLRLCKEVLVPVPAEFFPMHGLSRMMETLELARKEFPGQAGLMGVLVTMLDQRESISSEVLADLRSNLGSTLMDAIIYRDSQLVEAASYGKTIFEYNIFSKGARSYGELVREVIHGRTTVR